MRNVLLVCVVVGVVCSPLSGAYLFKDGQFIDAKNLATESIEAHFQRGLDALKLRKWNDACDQFHIVIASFEEASLAQEARYYLGVALYELGEFDLANDSLNEYLKKNNSPSHLEDVHRYKLSIAQKLAEGARRHPFGMQSLPRIMSGEELAVTIFDEVAAALPHHDLAAIALLGRATIQHNQELYLQAVETYQTVIRRFPESAFALKAFLGVTTSYEAALKREPQNVDVLALAEINYKEFCRVFPQAEEVKTVEMSVTKMQEIYSDALYQTGLLYERMSQPKSAVVYYSLAASKFPASEAAQRSRERMKELVSYANELGLAPVS
jgi:TolA-binding protein